MVQSRLLPEEYITSDKQGNPFRRVQLSVRDKPTPPPTICVVVTHDWALKSIEVIPDTGADSTVIGLQHLKSIVLTKSDLQLSPTLAYYSVMDPRPAILGSFQAKITYGKVSFTGWTDV